MAEQIDMSEGAVTYRIRRAIDDSKALDEMQGILQSDRYEMTSAYMDALARRCADAALGIQKAEAK